jgi:hypothetical protein
MYDNNNDNDIVNNNLENATDNALSDDGIEPLPQQQPRRIATRLSLVNNQLTSRGARHLAKLVDRAIARYQLVLSGNRRLLARRRAARLCEAMRRRPGVVVGLELDDCVYVVGIVYSTRCVCLIVGRFFVGSLHPKVIASLGQAMQAGCLVYLSLQNNDIDDKFAAVLAYGLSQNNTLQRCRR